MIRIQKAKTQADIIGAILLRQEVLVKETKHSTYDNEPDNGDISAPIFVAKEKGKVVGTLRVHNGYIQKFCISKSHRGKGLGKRLIDRASKETKSNLKLVCVPKNIPVFENMGFKKIRKQKESVLLQKR